MREIKNDKDITQIANEVVKAYGKQIRKNRTRDNNNSGRN